MWDHRFHTCGKKSSNIPATFAHKGLKVNIGPPDWTRCWQVLPAECSAGKKPTCSIDRSCFMLNFHLGINDKPDWLATISPKVKILDHISLQTWIFAHFKLNRTLFAAVGGCVPGCGALRPVLQETTLLKGIFHSYFPMSNEGFSQTFKIWIFAHFHSSPLKKHLRSKESGWNHFSMKWQ